MADIGHRQNTRVVDDDEEKFYGVFAPSWVTDEGFIEVLKAEAADAASDRDRALFLTAVDRIEDSERHLAAALRSIADQELMRVEIADLRAQVENRDVVAAVFDGEEERLRAELERERTQNRELVAALGELCTYVGETVVSGPSRMASMEHLMPSFERGREVLARAALSTQEESK